MTKSLLGAVVLFAACSTTQESPPSTNRVFTGPVFMTLDEARPIVRAVEVDDNGVIVALHDAPPAGAKIVQLDGALALPGLHDAHIHVLGIGQRQERVDLLGVKSAAEAKTRAAKFLEDNPEVPVLHGRGWDQSLFAGNVFPTKGDLEGLTDKPVILRRVDGHAAWVNQATLDLAGITAETADPQGGLIEKKEGQPTGILVDAAMDLVYQKLPAPALSDYERRLKAGLSACADAGLVAVHDMGFPVRAVDALEALDKKWDIPVRVFLYLDGSDDDALAALKKERSFRADVQLKGIKLLVDGAMGSRGAALLAPYHDQPETSGLMQYTSDELDQRVQPIHEAGFQVATHAIGDAGNRAILDAYVRAQEKSARDGARHRLEHAQFVDDADFARLNALGVIASMQPTHATSDMRWAEARVGPERVKNTYAWRRMLDLKVPLAFGSDAPVESEKVAYGLYAAVTRQDHAGSPEGGWRMDQALSLEESARAFSAGAAYAVHREADLGKLAVGYRLDVSVFDRDPREDPGQWIEARSTAIVTSGVIRAR